MGGILRAGVDLNKCRIRPPGRTLDIPALEDVLQASFLYKHEHILPSETFLLILVELEWNKDTARFCLGNNNIMGNFYHENIRLKMSWTSTAMGSLPDPFKAPF